jgi:hypothetical protein
MTFLDVLPWELLGWLAIQRFGSFLHILQENTHVNRIAGVLSRESCNRALCIFCPYLIHGLGYRRWLELASKQRWECWVVRGPHELGWLQPSKRLRRQRHVKPEPERHP